MPDRFSDERLDELERLADEDRRWGVFVHPDYARAAREAVPVLIAEVRALRRVAEAAEALFGLLYSGHASLTEDADKAAQRMRMALADWRRVGSGGGD